VEVRSAVAAVCAALDDPGFGRLAAQAGATGVLARIVTALNDPGAAAPAAELDHLDDLLARAGLDGLDLTSRAYQPLPGLPGHPVVEVYACALDRCSRIASAADPAPLCGVAGQPLRLVRLPT
jgi:hypothetical protein